MFVYILMWLCVCVYDWRLSFAPLYARVSFVTHIFLFLVCVCVRVCLYLLVRGGACLFVFWCIGSSSFAHSLP